MGRFKTEGMRAMKKMKRIGVKTEEDTPVPRGWRNNDKNQRLFKQIRAVQAAKNK